MRATSWAAWALTGVIACKEPPAAPDVPEPAGPARAGCVATQTNTWTPARNDAWVETLVYDDGGFLVDRLYDVEGPGTDFRQTWVRRADGAYAEYVVDLDDDGTIDEFEVYTYDGDDLVEHEHDYDGDGVIDERSTFVSEAGRVQRERLDADADGETDSLFVFAYDSADLLAEVTRDDGLDDVVEWIALYDYTDGLLTMYRADEGVDTFFEVYALHEYDELGRRTRYESFDVNRVDDTHVWTYEHADDDELADTGTWTVTSFGAFYEGATWAILRDDQGRDTQELWFYDFTGDGETDRTLTTAITWDCPS